jgi:hypothetical protein
MVALALLPVAAAGCTAANASSPRTYHVLADRFRYHGMPGRIESGTFQVAFSNREAFPFRHELVLVSLPVGDTADSVIKHAESEGADSEEDWLSWGEIAEVDTGATKVGTFDLPAGHYAFACWEDGRPGGGTGPVHAALRMVYPFTVAPGS